MHRTLTKRTGRIALWVTLVLVCSVALPVVIIGAYRDSPRESNKPARPANRPNAQQKIEPHLDRLDQASVQAAEKQVQRLHAFFAERKAGAKAFAEWPYSWTGKWNVIKGKLQADDGAAFRRFLQQKFDEHIFRAEELQSVLESALAAYLAETQGLENDMLVQLRADLADDRFFAGNLPQLQSDQSFQQEYQKMAEQVLPKVVEDMKIFATGQLGSFVGSEIASATLGRSLAARLGLSSGLLGTAARWGIVTFGVGLVSWFVLDYVVDWILQLAGHNPAGELATKVGQALDRTEAQLIEGDPAALAECQRLRQLAQDDPSPDIQQTSREEADRLEASGVLGLRHALQKLGELQSRLRREALLKLASAQGGQ